jgi:hypothetical protein
MSQATRWCFTEFALENNPQDWDKDNIEYCSWQEEKCPESGRNHYQGFLILKKKARLTQVKTAYSESAHWEVMRRSIKANEFYCGKEETRVAGPFSFGELKIIGPGQRTDLETLKRKIDEGKSIAEIVEESPEAARNEKELTLFKKIRNRRAWRQTWDRTVNLRWWQMEIMQRLMHLEDDRQVMWIYDRIGNTGKSFLGQYLEANEGYQVLHGGKQADLAHALDPDVRGYVFDFCRSEESYIPYKMLEQIKNKRVFSTKYESGPKYLMSHKLIVFANFMPDIKALSADRWMIYELLNNPVAIDGVSFMLKAVEDINPLSNPPSIPSSHYRSHDYQDDIFQ